MPIPVTIQIKENTTSVNVSGVIVSIWDDVLTSEITNLTTDNDGKIVASLLENTFYKIYLYKTGWSFSNLPYGLLVEESPKTVTYEGYDIPTKVIPPGTVKLYGYAYNILGSPLVAAKVFIRLTMAPQNINEYYYDNVIQETLTNESGYFEFLVPGQLHVTVTIPQCKFMQSGLLPVAGSMPVHHLGLTV